MRRYAETFFRNWIIAVIPVLLLSLFGIYQVHKAPKTFPVFANVWVNQNSLKGLSYTDPYAAPAQNMATSIGQLLGSPAFDVALARRSPLYWRSMAGPGCRARVANDIQANLHLTTSGPNVLTVSYTTVYGAAGAQVVQALLDAAPVIIDQLDRAQAAKGVSYYSSQVKSARARFVAATVALGAYMKASGIVPQDIAAQSLFDAKFATLYQAVQSAQADVQNTQQQLSQLQSRGTARTTMRVIDSPTIGVSSSGKKKALQSLAIFFIAGLLLGGGFIVVRTRLDRTIRFADEVPDLLGLPVVAVIPVQARQASKARPPRRPILAGERKAG